MTSHLQALDDAEVTRKALAREIREAALDHAKTIAGDPDGVLTGWRFMDAHEIYDLITLLTRAADALD